MNDLIPPRPRKFRVYITQFECFCTFEEGKTDITSILDAVWRSAHRFNMVILLENEPPPTF